MVGQATDDPPRDARSLRSRVLGGLDTSRATLRRALPRASLDLHGTGAITTGDGCAATLPATPVTVILVRECAEAVEGRAPVATG